MKQVVKIGIALLLAAMAVLFVVGCPDTVDPNTGDGDDDATLTRLRITSPGYPGTTGRADATLLNPGKTVASAEIGSITIKSFATDVNGNETLVASSLSVTATSKDRDAKKAYAKSTTQSPGTFGTFPRSLRNNDYLFVRVTSGSQILYYVVKITVEYIPVSGEGFGVSDPEFAAKYPYFVFPNLGQNELLTEETMPSPSYWNTISVGNGIQGHIHAYPDPFHFANGNKVVTLADWENRRKEIRLLMTFYMKGRVPSLDKDDVEITLSGTNNTTITIKNIATQVTVSGSSSVTANAALTVAGNEGKLGYGSAVSTTPSRHLSGNYLTISRSQIESLYGLPANHVTRDSAAAWNASVILTAIEGVDDSGEMQYFYPISKVGDPDPAVLEEGDRSWFTTRGALASEGVSTNGKLAMATAVYAEGRQGSRFGFANIGDSGGLGAAIERFVSPVGFRRNVSAQEALALSGFTQSEISALDLPSNFMNPIGTYGWPVDAAPIGSIGVITRTEAGSLGGEEDLYGYPYYHKAIVAGDKMYGDLHTYGTTSNDGQTAGRMRVMRGWSPYFEPFNHASTADAGGGTALTAARNANTKLPFVAYQTPSEAWSGIESAACARGESGYNWELLRFYEFNDMHMGMNIDRVRTDPSRTKRGFACQLPFDTYFANMLLAPYGGQIIAAPTHQMRTNQPSMWANWLITDEIYKFYGEQEYAEEHNNGVLVEDPEYPGSGLMMGWDKYIWNNLHANWWGTHAGLPTTTAINQHRSRMLENEGIGTTTDFAKTNIMIAKHRDPAFPVDDPVTYIGDFHKMDFGRPGAPTIAERVKRRVWPILKDYFLGEAYHQVPSTSSQAPFTQDTYHNAAKDAIQSGELVLTGPKFKPMDWRGLTSNPEPLD